MNWLLVVLVVANLLTFLWLSQHQESRHATERAQTDAATPEVARTIWLLSERDGMPVVMTGATPVEQSQEDIEAQLDPVTVTTELDTPEQPDESPGTDAVAGPPPQPVEVCQTIGPFKDRTASDPVVTWLEERGRVVSARSGKVNVRIGYWVYLNSMLATEAVRIMQELKNKGVMDYNQNARNEISLGIYVKQQIAEQRQKSIEALGYTPLVKPLYRNRIRYWVDVRETEADMLSAEEWDLHLANTPDSRRKSTACP
ncbi:MAG TPA: hypothetical protein DCO71_08440 [Gammaproteobacteria bacterium]|nr:hypothetical protein [Gammaproteobacteria bacterium]